MSTLRVPRTALATGTVIRIVDNGAGTAPRYVMESPYGNDALGVERWNTVTSFQTADVLAMLEATGFLAP